MTDDGRDEPAPGARRGILRNPYVLGFLAGVVVVTASVPLFRNVPEPPPVERMTTAWRLEDAQGAPVGAATLWGRVVLIGLADPSCARDCERVAGEMKRLEARYAELRAPVGLVTLLVGPTTPAQRADWAARHGAVAGRWDVAGSADDAACRVGLELMHRVVPADACAGAHAVAHQARLVLVDRSGGVRGIYAIDGIGLDEAFHRALSVLDAE